MQEKPPGEPSSGLIPREGRRAFSDPKKRHSMLLEAFLRNRKPSTLKNYQAALRDFVIFLGVDSEEAAVAHLFSMPQGEANALALTYRSELVDQHLAPNTINVRLAALKSMGKLARLLGLVPWALEVDSMKVQSYRDTSGPGRDAILKVLEDLSQKTDRTSLRNEAIIRILYTYALRRKEVAGLNLEDYDPRMSRLWILGKARTDQEPITVPINTKRSIEAWIEVRRPGQGPLFTNFDPSGKGGDRLSDKGVYRIVQQYGLGHTHGLRHSAITEALDKGLDVRAVRRFSRHKKLDTLMIYDDNRKDLGGDVAQRLDDDTGRKS